MNVLIAPDKYKGCLTAAEVGEAIQKGVLDNYADANCHYLYVSDGGDGFHKAVEYYHPSVVNKQVRTLDPLGREITASYLYDAEKRTAYIEMAVASGLALLENSRLDITKASSQGTGLLMKDAIENGAETIFVGVGGSATNDGGIGIAHALGFRFLDKHGNTLEPTGESLDRIFDIQKPDSFPVNLTVFAVNDVQNPLFGSSGAAYTYAAQKGASREEIEQLDLGLQNLHRIVKSVFGLDIANDPGSGAAGGAAYGLKAFLGAGFINGTSFILNLANFDKVIRDHNIDLLITGEGKMDSQTAYGKMIHGLTREANKYHIPVLAVCGRLEISDEQLRKIGIRLATEIHDETKPPGYSFDNAAALIRQKTTEILRSSEYL